MTILAALASAVLIIIAAIHLLWALGYWWPIRDERALAQAVIGTKGVERMPEVVEFYRMGGDIDYLLKICVPDVKDYDEVYKKLIAIAPLSDVSASFAMEAIKNTTELPL